MTRVDWFVCGVSTLSLILSVCTLVYGEIVDRRVRRRGRERLASLADDPRIRALGAKADLAELELRRRECR